MEQVAWQALKLGPESRSKRASGGRGYSYPRRPTVKDFKLVKCLGPEH
jgi:hypothetical protein